MVALSRRRSQDPPTPPPSFSVRVRGLHGDRGLDSTEPSDTQVVRQQRNNSIFNMTYNIRDGYQRGDKKAKVFAVCVCDQIIMRMMDTSIKVIAKHTPNATTSTLLDAPPINERRRQGCLYKLYS
jgi:hypothetical protein